MPTRRPPAPPARRPLPADALDEALLEGEAGDPSTEEASAWDADEAADLDADGGSDHITVSEDGVSFGGPDERSGADADGVLDDEGEDDASDDGLDDDDELDDDELDDDLDDDLDDEDEEAGARVRIGDDEDSAGNPGAAADISAVTARSRAFASRAPRPPGDAEPGHRSGMVALAGRPNAGKSTLLNRILGEKLAIMSPKPQTTRNRILGVHTEPGLQIALFDTPGLHKAHSRMNRSMVDQAVGALSEVDVVVWVLDAQEPSRRAQKQRPPLERAEHIVATILQREARGPIVVALNKVDRCDKEWLLPVIAGLAELLPGAHIVPVSALRGGGVRQLIEVLRPLLPEQPPLFPADMLTDASERFMVAELIREKVFHLTKEELPYATAIEVEQFTEEPEARGGKGRVVIFARILVERDGQKGIIIGKHGSMLKEIGTRARAEIEALLGTSVHLELHVSVRRDWSRDPRTLHTLGIE